MSDNIPAARLKLIQELVERDGVVSVKDAQEALNVSAITVRRDFHQLEQMGLVQRTRGGIVNMGGYVPDSTLADREVLNVEAKVAIGRRAAQLVEDGDTIFLSSGATCLALAQALDPQLSAVVVTNSFAALPELLKRPNLTVLSTGGSASLLNQDLIGPLAEASVAGFRASKAFVGASGVRSDGVYNTHLERAAVDRAMLSHALESYLLADHTKFGASAMVRLCGVDEFTACITDAGASTQDRMKLGDAGLHLIVSDQF